MSIDVIPDPLADRYASQAMRALWSPRSRVVLERELWIAVMETQRELGLDIPAEAIAAYEKVKDQVDDPLLDADWPDHPLTKVRRTLDQVVASIVLAPEVGDEQHLAPGW